jgi:thiosulfate dehydrogenase [quinone] large subunit
MSQTRSLAVAIGAAATVLLVWMVNPWISVPDGLSAIVTWAFWILSIVLVVVLYLDARRDPNSGAVETEGPAFARFLFSNSRAGLMWLPIRLFLGFTWLEAGIHKATGTGWLDGGTARKGYWTAAIAVSDTGKGPITYDWYREFITFLLNGGHYSWFAPLVTYGEILVGIALIFGALTGIASFFGAVMNFSYLLAGSTSSNPVLLMLAIGLMLAWKVAGYYGLDRVLLPLLGTPWSPGSAPAEMESPGLRPSEGG